MFTQSWSAARKYKLLLFRESHFTTLLLEAPAPHVQDRYQRDKIGQILTKSEYVYKS